MKKKNNLKKSIIGVSIHGIFLYLGEEERLRKTVTIHYVNKMIQCVVENSV